jgi:nucleotide-binding universal stress UspA family protein
MTKRIIIGVDGSDRSFAALRWGVREAHRRECEVFIIVGGHVPVVAPYYAPLLSAREWEMFAAEDHKLLDRAMAEAHLVNPTVPVDGQVVDAPAVRALVDAAGSEDIIAVGAQGAGGVLAALTGSVAQGVVHHATCPVIVVPDSAAALITNKIVVGVDGSDDSLIALRWALQTARETHATVDVVHVWSYPYQGPRTGVTEPRDLMELDAARALDNTLHAVVVERQGLTVHPVLAQGSPPDVLAERAADADLLVVATHGAGALRARIMGSVSHALLHAATCPLALIPTAR